ncbi:alpha/beta hydrolase [Nonomuraea thailandensis]
MCDVLVIVGPGVVADAGLLGEIARREFAVLGVRGRLVHARDTAHVRSLMREEAVVVVVPAPGSEATTLIRQPPGAGVVVPVDLDRVEGARHIHGRGIAGLAWGIRHAVHRARHPDVRRIAYGPSPEQWGDLYLPQSEDRVPVVALIHGGYWRSIWAADLMEALCADLAGRGFAVWNLEYRRPDLHGWAATTHDIATGLAALEEIGPATASGPVIAAGQGDGPAAARESAVAAGQGGGSGTAPGAAGQGGGSGTAPGAAGQVTRRQPALDLDRIAVAGHSAGAQLALRAVADGARVALAVSLAGVLDLAEADRRWLSHGAVASALGHGDAPGHGDATGDGGVPGGGRAPGDALSGSGLRASSPCSASPWASPSSSSRAGVTT